MRAIARAHRTLVRTTLDIRRTILFLFDGSERLAGTHSLLLCYSFGWSLFGQFGWPREFGYDGSPRVKVLRTWQYIHATHMWNGCYCHLGRFGLRFVMACITNIRSTRHFARTRSMTCTKINSTQLSIEFFPHKICANFYDDRYVDSNGLYYVRLRLVVDPNAKVFVVSRSSVFSDNWLLCITARRWHVFSALHFLLD